MKDKEKGNIKELLQGTGKYQSGCNLPECCQCKETIKTRY